MPTQTIDAAIVGGGIAGAWALNILRSRGYNAVLVESKALGCGQTLASQGMIHGGLKYALSGMVTGASEAIADMPARWRACLRGEDEVDLRDTALLSEHYYMFAAGSARGRFTTFFASRALRGRIEKVGKADWPQAFDGFDGALYALNDFVIDTSALMHTLTSAHRDRIFSLRADAHSIRAANDGGFLIELTDQTLHAAQLINCAGCGSEALLEQLRIADLRVQHRPLKQVIVRPRHRVSMYAHCLTGITGNEPRLTITTHSQDDSCVWYLGGQLATTGVTRSDAEQLQFAQQELRACVPWLDWDDAVYSVCAIDRAEPRQGSGLKPDQAFVSRVGDFVQCFPVKLTLAPDLGDRLLAVLDPPRHPGEITSAHARAAIGAPPW